MSDPLQNKVSRKNENFRRLFVGSSPSTVKVIKPTSRATSVDFQVVHKTSTLLTLVKSQWSAPSVKKPEVPVKRVIKRSC